MNKALHPHEKQHKTSLRLKITFGFLAIVLSFIAFLIWNNYYTIHIVQTKVSESYDNLAEFRARQIEESLQSAGYYLLRLSTSDFSYQYLNDLSIYPQSSGDYFLSVQWLIRKFQEDLSSYSPIDDFFVYSVRNNDLETGKRSYDDVQKYKTLLLPYLKKLNGSNQSWVVVRQGKSVDLVRTVKVNGNVYIGALVDTADLIKPFAKLKLADNGNVMLSDRSGTVLAQLSDMQPAKGESHAPLRLSKSLESGHLLIDVPITNTPLTLTVAIPKRSLLHEWLYFQRLMILIPLAGIILTLFYWTYLRQVVQKPLNRLIRAMRKIMNGNLDVYLPDESTKEISFMNSTFNSMVIQIKKLRIDIYEEKLRKQEIELKQLQAQIQPHFYLNSLNIISSLVVLDRNDLVKKMAEHLADYFRFIMQSNREHIQLGEELAHITNYLEIQKLRFPRKFDYEIDMADSFDSCLLLPLTVQPFVENAVIHGMGMGRRVFLVRISVRPAEERQGFLEIVIEDNGRGFPERMLAALQSCRLDELDEHRHHGIRNVLQRLQLADGDRVSVAFANRDEGGARIRLVFKERRNQAETGG